MASEGTFACVGYEPAQDEPGGWLELRREVMSFPRTWPLVVWVRILAAMYTPQSISLLGDNIPSAITQWLVTGHKSLQDGDSTRKTTDRKEHC